MDYHKLKQVVTPIAAAVPDVVSLFEQINISPDNWYTAIDFTNVSSLLIRPTTSCFLSVGKDNNTSSLPYLNGISTR